MILDDFLPLMLPRLKGCSEPIAKQAVHLAIIELCTKSKIWVAEQAEQDTIANQTGYGFNVTSGQTVIELRAVKLDGQYVELVDPSIGKDRDAVDWVSPYAYGEWGGFQLRPLGDAGRKIVTECVLAPSLTATSFLNAFGRYIEGIAHGALARLYAEKDKSYSDPAASVRSQSLWEDTLADAASDAFRGSARVGQYVKKHWF